MFELFQLGLVFVALLVIGFFAIYIYTLYHQLKKKRWLWFVLTLFFPILLVVYWIVMMFK